MSRGEKKAGQGKKRANRVQLALNVIHATQIMGMDVETACEEIYACVKSSHFSIDELEEAQDLYKAKTPEQLAMDRLESMELAEAVLREMGKIPASSNAVH